MPNQGNHVYMKNERRDGIAVMWDNRNKDSNNEGTELRVLIEMNLTQFNMTHIFSVRCMSPKLMHSPP